MKNLLVVALFVNVVYFVAGRPGNFEIEPQQFYKLSTVQPAARYNTQELTPDTKRILDEINKINIAFGYTRQNDKVNEFQPRISNEGYFYPKPVYNIYHTRYKNGIPSPTIRRYPFIARKIVHQHSVMIPNPQSYYDPAPYLHPPETNEPKEFQQNINDPNAMKWRNHKYLTIDKDVTKIVEYAPKYLEYLKDLRRSKETMDIYMLNNINNTMGKPTKVSVSIEEKEKSFSLFKPSKSSKPKTNALQKSVTTTKGPSKIYHIADSKKFFNLHKPANNTAVIKSPDLNVKPAKKDEDSVPGTIKATVVSDNSTTTRLPAIKSTNKEDEDDDYVDDEANVKGPFGWFKPQNKAQVSGIDPPDNGTQIVIQRLKVRRGGIAIAGPNGIATAGHGGTAIVGPGGLALTHPRSLTIAGPGTKVIKVPESTDLQKLALRVNAKNLKAVEQEGTLVATGPVVYYNDGS